MLQDVSYLSLCWLGPGFLVMPKPVSHFFIELTHSLGVFRFVVVQKIAQISSLDSNLALKLILYRRLSFCGSDWPFRLNFYC